MSATEIVGLAVAAVTLLGAGVAVGRWLVSAGEKKNAIETSITNGFEKVKLEVATSITAVKTEVTALGERVAGQIGTLTSRMDRQEQRAEAAEKERIERAAVDADRRAREAQEHGQAAERARRLEADVTELGVKVDELASRMTEQHEELRARVGQIGADLGHVRADLQRVDGHVKGHAAALQSQQTKLAVLERRVSTTSLQAVKDDASNG